MSLGVRIAQLRMSKKKSLQEVADAVGVSKAHIWQLEKGKTENPAMGLVTRLADYFGVTVSFLVGEQLDAPDADVQISRMFRQAKSLSRDELQLLSDMMASMLKRQGGAGGGKT